MILELAILNVKPGLQAEFENAFTEAQKIIQTMEGYLSHELQKCVEQDNRYVLLVNWCKLEDHTEGFRKSEPYKQWKTLLHHFYEPFPVVEHYELVFKN